MNNLTTTNGFALQPANFNEALQMAQMLSNSGMVSSAYKGKPQDTLVAMMMGAEIGLNPIQALQNISVINGKPSVWGDAALALVQNHPAYGGHSESFDEATMTATCTVWRKGDTEKHTATFDQKRATKAGLWGKQGPWKSYPERMLQMRARGFALRDKFADALNGLITREEAEDMPVERDVTPQAAPVVASPSLPTYPQEQFNEKFSGFEKAILGGKKTPEQIISLVESKYILTDEQRQQIEGVAA